MSSSLFSKYLCEIGAIPRLTQEREAELGRMVQAALRRNATETERQAGEEAQHELVQRSLKLVVGIAKRFLGGGLTLEEITSDGNQGLTEAAKRYDPSFKTRFSTYATWWIRRAIQDGIQRAQIIWTPVSRAMLLCKILNCQSFVEGAREQDLAQLEKETAVPRGTIARALGSVRSFVSLDARCDGSDEPLEAAIDNGCEHPLMAAMRVEEARLALAGLSKLDQIERHVIFARFGLDGETPRTLDSLARVYGVSYECIRQIEKRSLAILKRELAGADAIPPKGK